MIQVNTQNEINQHAYLTTGHICVRIIAQNCTLSHTIQHAEVLVIFFLKLQTIFIAHTLPIARDVELNNL